MSMSSMVTAFASGCKDEKARFREMGTSQANSESSGEANTVVKIKS